MYWLKVQALKTAAPLSPGTPWNGDQGRGNGSGLLPEHGSRPFALQMTLCRGLCRNCVVPAGVGPSLGVLLRYTQRAANMPETRMNTASPCHSVSSGCSPSEIEP